MAIPFDMPPERIAYMQNIQNITSAAPVPQLQNPFLMIENMLKEIMTLIRWSPIWTITDSYQTTLDAAENPTTGPTLRQSQQQRLQYYRIRLVRELPRNHQQQGQAQSPLAQQQQQQQQPRPTRSRPQPQPQQPTGERVEQSLGRQRPRVSQQQQTRDADEEHQRRLQRHLQRHLQRRQHEQQDPPPPQPPQPLPDLVTSCGVPAVEVKTAVAKPPATNTLTLRVELCSECYHNGHRLKVVGVTELVHDNGDDGAGTAAQDDEEESVAVNRCSKVKQRLMTLLQRTNIDTSLLTAVFVIVGWKVFIKH